MFHRKRRRRTGTRVCSDLKISSQGLDFSQYKPGNAVPFKKPKEAAAAATRVNATRKTKTKEATVEKGGKKETEVQDAAGDGGGEASRSETRAEVHNEGGQELPPKHSAGEDDHTPAE